MMNNATIYNSPAIIAPLSVVRKRKRLRNYIDEKKSYLITKRLIDIIFASLFILLVISWLLPIIALLIKLDSKGPVFFLQKRIGFGGKSFYCYKFRTMVINSEADEKQADDDDARITRFGWFLRKSNIDEFPQFFNVLMGSMSIVGPRPHMYADCRKFSTLLTEYKFRNMVKPGLTGLAQVKGYHGPTTSNKSVLMRYHWDHYYIRNINLLLDLNIIRTTAAQRIYSLVKYVLLSVRPQKWPSL